MKFNKENKQLLWEIWFISSLICVISFWSIGMTEYGINEYFHIWWKNMALSTLSFVWALCEGNKPDDDSDVSGV